MNRRFRGSKPRARAAFCIFLAGMVQHAIWFKTRITGHLIESLAYAAIVAGVFAGLWPGR